MLVVYFLIIEEVYNVKPPYGKLVYQNKTIKVKNTRKLRKKALRQIEIMRVMLKGYKMKHCYKDFVKCRNCICRETVCKMPKQPKYDK